MIRRESEGEKGDPERERKREHKSLVFITLQLFIKEYYPSKPISWLRFFKTNVVVLAVTTVVW